MRIMKITEVRIQQNHYVLTLVGKEIHKGEFEIHNNTMLIRQLLISVVGMVTFWGRFLKICQCLGIVQQQMKKVIE